MKDALKAALKGAAIGALLSLPALVLITGAPWAFAATVVVVIVLTMLSALYALTRFVVWAARRGQRA